MRGLFTMPNREQQSPDFEQSFQEIDNIIGNQQEQSSLPVSERKVVEKGLGLVFEKLNNSFRKESAGIVGKIPAVPGQMATFVTAAIIHELLDTSLPDMLGTIGKMHYEAARDT